MKAFRQGLYTTAARATRCVTPLPALFASDPIFDVHAARAPPCAFMYEPTLRRAPNWSMELLAVKAKVSTASVRSSLAP